MALEEPVRVSDVVQWETDPRYTRESVRFENDTGAAASFGVGHVLEDDTTHMQPADGTAFGAILLQDLGEVANAAGVDNVAVLVRGPAIVNQDALTWDAGATQATVITAMATAGIQVVQEPDNISEG
jgi:hypothetical protein